MADPASLTIRFLLYLDLMLLLGWPLFGLYALRATERGDASVLRLRAGTIMLAAAAVPLSLLALLLLAASMTGLPPADVDHETIMMLVRSTPTGWAWAARMAALLGALLMPLLLWHRPTMALGGSAAAAAFALASLAWTGHGAMDEGAGGWIHLVADIIHLLAAGLWIGALAAFAALLFRPARTLSDSHVRLCHRALSGFSRTGMFAVAVLGLTGLANGWFLIGPAQASALAQSLYGQLLSAKLLLFAGMIGLAAVNRFRLTPALGHAAKGMVTRAHAVGALRRSLAAEAGLGLAILILVAWLGTLAPPAAAN